MKFLCEYVVQSCAEGAAKFALSDIIHYDVHVLKL